MKRAFPHEARPLPWDASTRISFNRRGPAADASPRALTRNHRVATVGHFSAAEQVDINMVTRGRFRLLVLGDSIAYGTGARLLEDTIGRRLVRSLEREGYDAILDVLAVPGATTRDLAAQVRRAASLGADLALIVVGANDLTG